MVRVTLLGEPHVTLEVDSAFVEVDLSPRRSLVQVQFDRHGNHLRVDVC